MSQSLNYQFWPGNFFLVHNRQTVCELNIYFSKNYCSRLASRDKITESGRSLALTRPSNTSLVAWHCLIQFPLMANSKREENHAKENKLYKFCLENFMQSSFS